MSIRLEMLQVARLAPKSLGDSVELVETFIRSRLNDDGGFQDRTGKSDLYYTVFGIESLLAVQTELPSEKIKGYLDSFDDGHALDLVHLCCLARCYAALSTRLDESVRGNIAANIEKHRSGDGGYHQFTASKTATVYANFLAVAAYQDLNLPVPNPLGLIQSLKFLETDDGAWANDRLIKAGSTNATAAAVTLLRNLNMPINLRVAEWLLKQSHSQGGFVAVPGAPIPDLLSTATALHALAGLEADVSEIKEKCLDFVDSLWTNEGGFYGHWSDEHLDCEYTYYGLLALGHLSL